MKNPLGEQGELAAVSFLQERGLKILQRNFRIRGGEIDIIAEDQGTLCFVEVKTRRSGRYGGAQESVSWFKKNRLIKAGLYYLSLQDQPDRDARFDLIAITFRNASPQITWIRNIWDVE